MIISCTLAGISGYVTTAVAQYSLIGFFIGRFIMFGCVHGASIVSFVYTMEMLAPNLRASFGIMVNIFGAFGFMTLSIIPFISNKWEVMSWTISCYPMVILLVALFIPESFKWHFSKGHVKEGRKAFLDFCGKCNHNVDDDVIQEICKQNTIVSGNSRSYTLIDLVRYKQLKSITIKNAFIWFSVLMRRVQQLYFSRDLKNTIIILD